MALIRRSGLGTRLRGAAAALLALAGCGQEPALGQAGAALRGGVFAPDDVAVGALRVVTTDGREGLCSAALIAPRLALTAAHCVAPSVVGQGARFSLFLGADLAAGDGERPSGAAVVDPQPLTVAAVRFDSVFDPGLLQLGHDVGALLLAQSAVVPPLPVLTTAPPGLTQVRLVGYGAAAAGATPSGQRQTVVAPVNAMRGALLAVGNAEASSCAGDSGGPALARAAPDQPEAIIGVVSYASGDCGTSAVVAGLSASAAALAAWTAEAEQPSAPGCQVGGTAARRAPWSPAPLTLPGLILLLRLGRGRTRRSRGSPGACAG